MEAQQIICWVIGLSQGYFSLPIFRGLVKALTTSTALIIGDRVGRVVSATTAICAFILAPVIFFGLAAVWILFLSQGGGEAAASLGRYWGKGWFLGLILFFICAALAKREKSRAVK